MDTHTTQRLWLDWVMALFIFILALAVYNATLAPSLSYKSPDGNELATIPYILGLAHSTGYPLYTWLGKLFTYLLIGDVAHRMNLMSAVLCGGRDRGQAGRGRRREWLRLSPSSAGSTAEVRPW